MYFTGALFPISSSLYPLFCPLSSVLCPSVLLSSDLCPLISDFWLLISDICHLTSVLWHLTSDLCPLSSIFRFKPLSPFSYSFPQIKQHSLPSSSLLLFCSSAFSWSWSLPSDLWLLTSDFWPLTSDLRHPCPLISDFCLLTSIFPFNVHYSTCPQRSRPSASRALGKQAGLRGGRVFVIHLFFIQPLTYLHSFKNK